MGPMHIGLLDLIVGLFLASFVVMPMATLAHELGHAVLALRFSVDQVTVQVGRPPAMVEVTGERLSIRWSLLPARGVPFAGLCLWNARYATDLERVAVFLAGPLVTALLIPMFLWATVASLGSPDWLTATFLMAALGALISLLFNVDPRSTDGELRAGQIRRDGPRARAAFRAWRGP